MAHRTSPTNIGMGLLATLAAHDLGYVTTRELVTRVEGTLDTVEGLESHEGHLFNWYDTESLAPLIPRYVSTVDSGNLAASLLTLASGLEELATIAQTRRQLLEGVRDTAALLAAAAAPPRITRAMEADDRGLAPLRGIARSVLEGLSEMGTEEVTDEALLGWKDALEVEIGAAAVPIPADTSQEAVAWATALHQGLSACVASGADDQQGGSADAAALAVRCRSLAEGMRFEFLYDRSRHLFAIGYRLADEDGPGRLDARFTICWLRRRGWPAISPSPAAPYRSGTGFISAGPRSASTECPHSFRGAPRCSSTSCRRSSCASFRTRCSTPRAECAVRRQIQYGRRRGVPWGISESAFNVRDRHETYQYKAFGVPGLGLKRGLADELVVAPYATALAIPFEPEGAVRNLKRLASEGALGHFGFYDAIDYTSRKTEEDPTAGETAVVVRAFMAHHQGMSLVALTNALRADVDGATLSFGLSGAGHGASSSGARSTPGGRRAAAARGGSARRPIPAVIGTSPIPHAAHVLSAHAVSVERVVRHRRHQRRRGVQPMARPGGDTMAGGSDVRLGGSGDLPPRRAFRRAVVGHLPTDLPRAR